MYKKKNHLPGKLNHSGFTVFELVVAVTIASILAYIAIPNYNAINASIERMNVRKIVLQDLRRAQAESVTHGCRGIYKISADKRSYSFGCDFLPYDGAVPPSADQITFSRVLPNNFYIASDGPVIFNSRGQVVDATHLIDSRVITLSDTSSGTSMAFATGMIAGTGVFEYE